MNNNKLNNIGSYIDDYKDYCISCDISYLDSESLENYLTWIEEDVRNEIEKDIEQIEWEMKMAKAD